MFRLPQLMAALLVVGLQDPYTVKVDVPVVSVDVVVADSKDSLVNDLAKADFQIFEDGVEQEVRFFSPVSAPYNVFLLFDRSESTRDNRTFMQKAVVKFIEGLRPQDRVALGSFDEGYEILVPWTSNHSTVVRALDKLVAVRESNGTRFYAALDRTLRREFKNAAGRRAVVVFTDGKDTDLAFESDKELRRALKSSQEERIPVYIVALENAQDKFAILPTSRRYLNDIRDNMRQLSDLSGGQTLFSKSLEEIAGMYAELGRALGTSYSLGYIPLQERRGGYRRVEVKTRPTGLRVTQSRQGYTYR